MSHPEKSHRSSRRQRFPFLALFGLLTALAAVAAMVQLLSSDPGDTPATAEVIPGADTNAEAGTELPEGALGVETGLVPAAEDPDAAEKASAAALVEAIAAADYARRPTLHGRLLADDGLPLPQGIELWASVEQPFPKLSGLLDRGIGAQPFSRLDESDMDYTFGPAVLRKLTLTRPAEDGRFQLENVPASGAWLAVGHDQLYPSEPVNLADWSDDEESDVVLIRGARIVGTVTGPGDEPLPKVSIEARSKIDAFFMFDGDTQTVELEDTRSGSEGRFAINQVPPGCELTLLFEHHELEAGTARVPPLNRGSTHELTMELVAGAVLGGLVATAEGTPVADARVMINPAALDMTKLDSMGRLPESSTRTGDDGRFEFQQLPAGSYRVSLAVDQYQLVKSDPIELVSGQREMGIELLAESGLSVSGFVLDSTGAPIPSARVQAASPPSMFNMQANLEREFRERRGVEDDGSFSLSGYDEGELRVWATASQFVSASVDVDAGDLGVVITLQRKTSVSGIAISLGDAEPVTDYVLRLTPSGSLFDLTKIMDMSERLQNLPGPLQVHDEQGRFEMTNVPPGLYDAALAADGYARTVITGIDVIEDEGARGIVILVPDEAKLVGEVVSGRTGEPLAGATLTTGKMDIMNRISNMMVGDVQKAKTDEEGRFELAGLGAEPITLTVEHPSHQSLGLESITLRPNEKRDLGVLRLSPGATLYGTLREETGETSEGTTIFAANASGSSFKRGVTNSQGEWRIEGLGAGTYNVTRMDFSMDMGSDNPASYLADMVYKSVTVEQDEEKRVDLSRGAGGTTELTGIVSSATGPEVHAMIWAVQEDGSGALRFATTDEDGRYSIVGLESGHYLLQVLPSTNVAVGAGSQPVAPVAKSVVLGDGPVQRENIHVPGGSLVGKVVEKRSGQAASGVRVLLERTDDGRPTSRILEATGGRQGEAFSDDAGAFTFGHLSDGNYRLVAGGTNLLGIGESAYAITRVDDIPVADGRQGFTVKIEVERAGGVTGTVRDLGGQPLTGVPVWALDEHTGLWASVLSETNTNAGGIYELNSLGPGPWTLVFGGNTHALTFGGTVNVRRDALTDLDVALPRGVELWVDTSPYRAAEVSTQLVGNAGILPLQLSSIDVLMGGSRSIHRRRLGRFAAGSYDLVLRRDGETLLQTKLHLTESGGPKTVSLGAGD